VRHVNGAAPATFAYGAGRIAANNSGQVADTNQYQILGAGWGWPYVPDKETVGVKGFLFVGRKGYKDQSIVSCNDPAPPGAMLTPREDGTRLGLHPSAFLGVLGGK
jgi:hypothetical protein